MAEVAGARKRTEAPSGGDGRAAGEVSQSLPCDIRSQHSNSDISQPSNMATWPKNGMEESVTLIAFLLISCLNTA